MTSTLIIIIIVILSIVVGFMNETENPIAYISGEVITTDPSYTDDDSLIEYSSAIPIPFQQFENPILNPINNPKINNFKNPINSNSPKRIVKNLYATDLNIRAVKELQTLFDFDFDKYEIDFKPGIPPQFMLDLFNSVTDSFGILKTETPHHARLVKGFVESNVSRSDYLYFDVDEPNPEWILEAELQLYRVPVDIKDLHPSIFMSPYYLVSVYQVLDMNLLDNPDVHRLLNVHYVGALSSGWQVFNVKQAVLSWLSGSSRNLGLLVIATTMGGEQLPAPGVRYVRRRYASNGAHQPLVVLFETDRKIPEVMITTVNDTNEAEEKTQTIEQEQEKITDSKKRKKRSFTPMHDTDFSCQLHEMAIDFKQIKWSDYVIAPKFYQAMQCKGQCAFPMDEERHRPTNHARAQNVGGILYGNDVEDVCCVPTDLTNFCLLYFDRNYNVVFKIYDEMVAVECGCR